MLVLDHGSAKSLRRSWNAHLRGALAACTMPETACNGLPPPPNKLPKLKPIVLKSIRFLDAVCAVNLKAQWDLNERESRQSKKLENVGPDVVFLEVHRLFHLIKFEFISAAVFILSISRQVFFQLIVSLLLNSPLTSAFRDPSTSPYHSSRTSTPQTHVIIFELDDAHIQAAPARFTRRRCQTKPH